jgi:putative ABC transport system permease protein
MKYVPLVWRSLLRRKLRTTFTLLSILVAFLLFCFLMAIKMAFNMGVELAGADRLITTHKTSLIQPLPERYLTRIEATQGVTDVAFASWFGGIYQDPSNFFAQFAVDPERWTRMYPEFVIPPEHKKRWLAERTSAVVGRSTAEKFGWKVGDRIPIQGTIFHPKNGGLTWEFTIAGIYDGAPGTDTTQFFFRHDYLDENRRGWAGMVGWYIVRIGDANAAADVSKQIDALFANSPAETKTQPEKQFVAAFANQVGDIGTIMMAILAAVFFTILLVAGNTMAQSVRERTSELAVLKTLGFSDGRVLALVLLESCLIAALGGFLGLAIGWAIVRQGDPTNGLLPAFYLPARDIALGIGCVVLLGLVTGLLPALQAGRLRIVDALRKV